VFRQHVDGLKFPGSGLKRQAGYRAAFTTEKRGATAAIRIAWRMVSAGFDLIVGAAVERAARYGAKQ
jgi:hypothetical protein